MSNDPMSNESAVPAGKAFVRRRGWQRLLPLGLTVGFPAWLRGENHVDYRYEYYQEDRHRMKIETHSVYFEQKLMDQVVAKGELTYDGISGATPVGVMNMSTGKPLVTEVTDIRRAESIELDWKLGSHTLTPGFSHSQERDYKSYGLSLSDAIEFNDKNTVLQYGVSHNFDTVRHADGATWSDKDSTDGIIGISQLLSPKTIFTAAFTFGNDSGYLSDPYRQAQYDLVFPGGVLIPQQVPEKRPAHRNKEILYTSLTYYVDPLDASLEGSYRFYHDSYGVFSHTAGLTWHQWLGRHVMVEPMFRFSEQSAADFYSTSFPSPFPLVLSSGYYSSDYRLSELYTLDCGLQVTVMLCEHARITAGYHRYEMHGLDGKTSQDMYPQANVFTVGLSILW